MRRHVRVLLVCLTTVCAAAGSSAAPLPPVSGELSGGLLPTFLPGGPPLSWKIVATEAAQDTRHVVLAGDGPGAMVRVECDVNLSSGDGRWRITEAVFDAAKWFSPAMTRLAPSAKSIAADGPVHVTGSGVLLGTAISGRLTVHWPDATLKDPAGAWTLSGVTLDGEFDFDAARGSFRSAGPGVFSVRTITTKRFGARNLAGTAVLADDRTVRLQRATIEIAGGNVVAAPATIPLRPLNIQLDVRFTHIGLEDIAQFLPYEVAEARGLVDGIAHLGWTPAEGIEVGAGQLSLRSGSPALVRLMPKPGLITSTLRDDPNATIQLYRGLDQVELGKVPIVAESLEARYTPKGDEEGRQAYVHLYGKYPNGLAPLDLTVNFRGPIGDLIRFYANPRLHVGTGK